MGKEEERGAPGLTPIGSLLPRILPTASAMDSRSRKSKAMPRDSATTSLSAPVGPRPGSTGIGPSATGSLEKLPAPSELQAMAPHDIDRALQEWLPPRVASSVKPDRRWRPRDAQDGDWDDRYTFGWNLVPDFDEDEGREAIRLLEMLCTQAKPANCAKEVARLKVMTKATAQTGEDMTFQIAVMADELAAYPFDVVRDACRTWAAANTFFPSWAELKRLCDKRVLKRRSLLAELHRHFAANETTP